MRLDFAWPSGTKQGIKFFLWTERVRYVLTQLAFHCQGKILVAYEEPFLPPAIKKKGGAIFQSAMQVLYYLRGALYVMEYQLKELQLIPVHPTSLKKYTGYGRASKQDIQDWANRILIDQGWKEETMRGLKFDEADAIALALIASSNLPQGEIHA